MFLSFFFFFAYNYNSDIMRYLLSIVFFYTSLFSIASTSDIRDIEVNGDNIWVCFSDKIVKYNSVTGEKQIYTSQGLGTGTYQFKFTSLGCYQNKLFVGSSNGLFQLQEDVFVECERGYLQNILEIEENGGSLWITGIGGVLKLDESTETFWECGALFLSSSQVVGLAFGSDGSAWVTERNTGLSKIADGKLNYMEDYSKVSWHAGWMNGKIAVDQRNQCVWEAQYLGGELRCYHMTDSVITVESNDEGLIPMTKAYDVMMDADALWVASDNMLVRRMDGENSYYPAIDGYSLLTMDMDNAGNIWCGTSNGNLVKFDGVDYQYIPISDLLQGISDDAQQKRPVIQRDGTRLILNQPAENKVEGLRIYDVTGKLLHEINVSSSEIFESVNLSNLSSKQIYVIELILQEGKYSEKICW